MSQWPAAPAAPPLPSRPRPVTPHTPTAVNHASPCAASRAPSSIWPPAVRKQRPRSRIRPFTAPSPAAAAAVPPPRALPAAPPSSLRVHHAACSPSTGAPWSLPSPPTRKKRPRTRNRRLWPVSRVPPPLPLRPLPPPRPTSRPPPRRPSHPPPPFPRPLRVQSTRPAALKRARPHLQPLSRCSRRSRRRTSAWSRPAAPILLSLRRCSLQRRLRSRKERPAAPADREIIEKNVDRPNRLAVRTRTKGQGCRPRPPRPDCVSTTAAALFPRVQARRQCLARTWCFRAPPPPRPPQPLPLQPPPLCRCAPFLRVRPPLSDLLLHRRWPTVPKSLFFTRKRPRRVAPPLVQSQPQSSPARSRPPR